MYHTPHITVSYTRQHCIINQTSLHDTRDLNASYLRHHCIIHKTSMYHPPDITVSYTIHHYIIHHTLEQLVVVSSHHQMSRRSLVLLSCLFCSISWHLQWQLMHGDLDTVTSDCTPGIWYSYVWCMIWSGLVYDTVMFGVWYCHVWCMIQFTPFTDRFPSRRSRTAQNEAAHHTVIFGV